MLIIDQLKKADRKLQCVAFGTLAGLCVLLAGLWYVQVVRADRYRANLQDQSVRTVRVPAIRGKILDRNRFPLAENRPSYNVNLYLEELRQNFRHEYTNGVKREFRLAHPNLPIKGKTLEELERQSRYRVVSNILMRASSAIREPRLLLEPDFHAHYDKLRSLPLPLLKDLEKTQVALFVEQTGDIPSLALEPQALRHYPYKTALAHMLGHLRREDAPVANEEIAFRFRLPDYIGAKGIESALDSELRGKAGVKLVLVNSMQYRQSEEVLFSTEPGQNIQLTIDLPIQLAAEQALAKAGNNVRGAVVVLDTNTGDIYALVSAPAFDPNKFVTGLSQDEWTRMNDEELKPMFNRATYGAYAPGSSFKIIVALAGLEAGTIDPEEVYESRGFYMMRGRRLPIHDTAPAGPYKFRRAFYRSSNSYFVEHGVRVGPEKIIAMARRFHLGERTGLQPKLEDPGALPGPGQPRKLDGSVWTGGDTANLSIGHGEILVTPLQMAVVTAAVANGGKILQPRLIMQVEPQDESDTAKIIRYPSGQIRGEVKLNPKDLALVQQAMLDDVEEIRDNGTGRAAAIPGFRIAGKTGTAKLRPDYAVTWFVSYAPFENPRYAVVVVVEGGVSGGGTCAPVAREIYKAIIKRDPGQLSQSQPLAQGTEFGLKQIAAAAPTRPAETRTE